MLFATVRSLPAFYAVWAGLGTVMAMVLYEPAFAIVATSFVRHRDRALTTAALVAMPWTIRQAGRPHPLLATPEA